MKDAICSVLGRQADHPSRRKHTTFVALHSGDHGSPLSFAALVSEYSFNFWTLLVNCTCLEWGLAFVCLCAPGTKILILKCRSIGIIWHRMDWDPCTALGNGQTPSVWILTAKDGGGFRNHHYYTDIFLLIISNTLEIKKLRFQGGWGRFQLLSD